MNRRYVVVVREVWEQPKEIEAASSDEALQRVARGEGECIEKAFAYSHDRSSQEWTVEECMRAGSDGSGGNSAPQRQP